MSDRFWAALSAIATAAAFFVVAWQSILTRHALKVARDALLDGARARLDDQAPAVAVRLEEPVWPLLAWSQQGMPVNPWPNGHSWHFPRNTWERTVLQAVVVVENLSDRRLQVSFDGDLVVEEDNRPRPARQLLVEPRRGDTGGEVRVYLQNNFTAEELAENWSASEAGEPLPHRVTGIVTVHDDRDNGVTDTWQLELTGCPLQPDPERGSVWQFVPYSMTEGPGVRSLQYELQPPRQRTYWVSRKQGQELPRPLLPA